MSFVRLHRPIRDNQEIKLYHKHNYALVLKKIQRETLEGHGKLEDAVHELSHQNTSRRLW